MTTSSRARVRDMLSAILLLAPGEYRDDMRQSPVDTRDSVAVVAIGSALEEEFGVTLEPEEFLQLQSVADIERLLRERGVWVDGD